MSTATTAPKRTDPDLVELAKEEFVIAARAFFAPVVGTTLALRLLRRHVFAPAAPDNRADDRDDLRAPDDAGPTVAPEADPGDPRASRAKVGSAL